MNAKGYYQFMKMSKKQCQKLKADMPDEPNLLKAIDEYNFWKYAWPKQQSSKKHRGGTLKQGG